MKSYGVPFYRRQKVKDFALILGVLLVLAAYKTIPPLNRLADRLIDPAVAGITVAYGHLSTFVQRTTGFDLGFVEEPVDQEFLFRVRLATYINERQAKPLLEIAVDRRMDNDKRERALRALLQFESVSEWIQPFLNEIYKGGMLGLYDPTTPVLDDLMKKIRAEGGVRQPLVRAYAEVVFSFMMQVPDAIIRQHALRWVSDVIAEDALFLIIPRIDQEANPEVRTAIEGALFDVRAVSDVENARALLIPIYKQAPWPSIRLPLAVVLLRLGYDPAAEYLAFAVKSNALDESDLVAVRVALARTRFPKELRINEAEARQLAQRVSDRRQQMQLAMDRREKMVLQERTKRALIARRTEPTAPVSAVVEPPPPVEEKPAAPVTKPDVPALPKTSVTTPEKKRQPAPPPAVARKEISAKPAAPAERPATADYDPDARDVAPVAPRAEREAPRGFGVPGELTPEEKQESADEAVELARLPDNVLPPPLEQGIDKKPRSLMNYVDVVFEVKTDAPVYQNPGEKKGFDMTLPAGTKGKASFEVLIGEDRWYQVKTGKGSGWVEAKHLSAFNLTPDNVVPATGDKAAVADSMDGDRAEETYFEATTEDVPVYKLPSEGAKVIGKLQVGPVYRAVESKKIGPNRWFKLQIRAGEEGWVLGDINLQLANVVQSSQMKIPEKTSLKAEPAFAAGWVTASVKGVGVYARNSMAGDMITTINPGAVFKVVEKTEGGGSEWYKIQMPGRKLGWVQAMDVKITKAPAK